MAAEPDVLILDEPMSSLDVTVRARVRRELRSSIENFPGIKIVITHSPIEAMALADRLVILEEGRVAQEGSVSEVRMRPRSPYVAALAGLTLLRGTIEDGDGHRRLVTETGTLIVASDLPSGDPVLASVDPTAIALQKQKPSGGSARNVLPATVEEIDPVGDRVRVTLGSRPLLVAEITREAADDLRLHAGDEVWAVFKATQIEVYPA
jgi:molybdate transport system ATP-binding protein